MRRDHDDGVALGEAKAIRETAKAILVRAQNLGSGEYWVPKSQIHERSDVTEAGDEGELVVSTWLAKQNGWE